MEPGGSLSLRFVPGSGKESARHCLIPSGVLNRFCAILNRDDEDSFLCPVRAVRGCFKRSAHLRSPGKLRLLFPTRKTCILTLLATFCAGSVTSLSLLTLRLRGFRHQSPLVLTRSVHGPLRWLGYIPACQSSGCSILFYLERPLITTYGTSPASAVSLGTLYLHVSSGCSVLV